MKDYNKVFMGHELISKDNTLNAGNIQKIIRVITDPIELSRLIAGTSSLNFAQTTLMLGH